MSVIGAGKAPALNRPTSCCASATVKLPRDHGRTTGDRALYGRSFYQLVVEEYRERLSDIRRRYLTEYFCSVSIEIDLHLRLAGRLVKNERCPRNVLAGKVCIHILRPRCRLLDLAKIEERRLPDLIDRIAYVTHAGEIDKKLRLVTRLRGINVRFAHPVEVDTLFNNVAQAGHDRILVGRRNVRKVHLVDQVTASHKVQPEAPWHPLGADPLWVNEKSRGDSHENDKR